MLIETITGIKCKHKEELFGVEIEMEGASLHSQNFGNWKIVGDGSLQGGLEYVMATPKKFTATVLDIENLYMQFRESRSVLAPSIRAGVHVHYNVQSWDLKKLFTFLCTYLTVENIMIKNFAGKGRFGNLFCIPASRAEVFTDYVVSFLRDGNANYLMDDNIRYSAINLNSLFKYGSLEFRSLATPKKPDEVIRWVSIIKNLSKYSQQFDSPKDVVNNFSAVMSKEFLDRMFGYPVSEFDMSDFWEGVEQAQQIAFCVQDWDDIGANWGQKARSKNTTRGAEGDRIVLDVNWQVIAAAGFDAGRQLNGDAPNFIQELPEEFEDEEEEEEEF